MQKKIVIPVLALGLALGGTAAFAADQPPPGGPMGPGHHWRMDRKDMARHFKNRCEDRYAHVVGTMAYLETRLQLKANQKSAFNDWKGVVVRTARKRTDACLAMKPPAKRPSLIERIRFREKMLEGRLDAMKAQMPALETLTASLDKTQEHILGRALHKMMREGRDHRGHRGHRGDRGFGHGRMDGPMHGRGPMPGPGPDGPGGPN